MTSSYLHRTVLLLLVALVLLIYVFPYAFLVSTSLKPPQDALEIPPTLLPQRISFDNYTNIGEFPAVQRSFSNSVIIALLSTAISITLAVPAAYGIARYSTWVGKLFLILALVTRLIPAVSVGIPLFAIMRSLGLIDTHIGVALAHSTISVPLAILAYGKFHGRHPARIGRSRASRWLLAFWRALPRNHSCRCWRDRCHGDIRLFGLVE